MKKPIIYLALMVLVNLATAQSPEIEWQNTIGGNDSDSLVSVIQTTDGGYLLGGYSYSGMSWDKTEFSLGSCDYWIVKVDASGTIEWQNTIGGSDADELYSVIQTADGGYLLGGSSSSDISGDKTEAFIGGYDYWIVKLDASGTIEWQNTIGGSASDKIRSVIQTTDGGYLLGGFSYSGISGDKTEASVGYNDYWIVKLDASGIIEWQNTIGGGYLDYLESVIQTTDGGYLLGGLSYSGHSGDKTEDNMTEGSIGLADYWIVKVDASGTIEGQNTIGGKKSDFLYSVIQTTDGGYLLGGSSDSGYSGDKTENSRGAYDYWIVKADASGTIEWQNTIGGSSFDDLKSIVQTTDGGYLLGGSSLSYISWDKTENSKGEYDYWIVKVDASGTIEWQKTIGGSNTDKLRSVIQTTDGGYLLGGTSGSDISGDKTETSHSNDYWIVKLEGTSISTISTNLPDFEIFPNPNNGIFKIQFENYSSAEICIQIFNMLGQNLY